MDEKLKEIKQIINNPKNNNFSQLRELLNSLFLTLHSKIDNYIGDYPTFIEPVYLENNVKIGDDVLLGPNVYIGENTVIGDFVEISNSVLFENVNVGENLKLENCIIVENSGLNFINSSLSNCIIMGISDSEKKINKINF